MEGRCQGMEPLLMQLAGGELSSADGPAVADHLAECARCRREWEALRAWLDALSAMPRVSPPAGPRQAVLRILDAEREARVTRRAWRGLGVAAAAFLAAVGAWLTSSTAPPPGDPAGVRWRGPYLPRFEEARWASDIDSSLIDVWFSLRDLREGRRAVQPVTPPDEIASSRPSELADDARALRWEWGRDEEDGGFDLRVKDLMDSIESLSSGDQG